MRQFYVYIMTNRSGTLYVGMSNDLERRVREHKLKVVPGFTAKYRVDRLVYFESFPTPAAAIQREKQIKGWMRHKKVALIESGNPEWNDLAADWLEAEKIDRMPEDLPPANGQDSSLRSE